jgi:hypothetical protein
MDVCEGSIPCLLGFHPITIRVIILDYVEEIYSLPLPLILLLSPLSWIYWNFLLPQYILYPFFSSCSPHPLPHFSLCFLTHSFPHLLIEPFSHFIHSYHFLHPYILLISLLPLFFTTLLAYSSFCLFSLFPSSIPSSLFDSLSSSFPSSIVFLCSSLCLSSPPLFSLEFLCSLS